MFKFRLGGKGKVPLNCQREVMRKRRLNEHIQVN